MGKYDPLRDYLRRQRAQEFELTFGEIERRLGAMLPKGAERAQWWAGDACAKTPRSSARPGEPPGLTPFSLLARTGCGFVVRRPESVTPTL